MNKLAACFVVALAMLLAPMLVAQESNNIETAKKLIERIEKRPDRAWDYAFTLRTMSKGDDATKLLGVFEEGLDSDSESVQMVCARLVLLMGDAEMAYETLADLLESDDSAVIEAVANILADEGPEDEDLIEALTDRFEDSDDLSAGARVALAQSVHWCVGDPLAVDAMREFASSSGAELASRAALALSAIGEGRETRARLREVARQPGDVGRLARISVSVEQTDEAVEDIKKGAATATEPLVTTLIRTLRKHYVDDHFWRGEDKTELSVENLVDAAGRGMGRGVDRYSTLLTPQEIKEMNEDSAGRYVGIGAHVREDEENGGIIITQPIYNGPAYNGGKGVRSGDRIVAVLDGDGNRVDMTKKTLEDGIDLVRGAPGTTATIFVKRRGVDKELRFDIPRRVVSVDTALESMLPGGVGYIRLTRFGTNGTKDMKESMENLRRRGMTSLVLDLRGNPGGSLKTVIEIAEMFLPRGTPIASAGGRFGDWKGRKRPFRSQGGKFKDLPLTVLIDGDSASGSEMLSGALRDNKRAVVIGRATFGKGIGQSFWTIPESNGRMLKCTVFEYYLPTGESIDRYSGSQGVKPHIVTKPRLLESWQVYAVDKLRKSKRVEEYLDEHYRGEQVALMMKLADFDGLDSSLWPDFDKFYASLNTMLAKDDVRRELRAELRRRVQDDRGEVFTQNWIEDPTLQRAIKELYKIQKKDPMTVKEFKQVMKN